MFVPRIAANPYNFFLNLASKTALQTGQIIYSALTALSYIAYLPIAAAKSTYTFCVSPFVAKQQQPISPPQDQETLDPQFKQLRDHLLNHKNALENLKGDPWDSIGLKISLFYNHIAEINGIYPKILQEIAQCDFDEQASAIAKKAANIEKIFIEKMQLPAFQKKLKKYLKEKIDEVTAIEKTSTRAESLCMGSYGSTVQTRFIALKALINIESNAEKYQKLIRSYSKFIDYKQNLEHFRTFQRDKKWNPRLHGPSDLNKVNGWLADIAEQEETRPLEEAHQELKTDLTKLKEILSKYVKIIENAQTLEALETVRKFMQEDRDSSAENLTDIRT